jgi:hypothetical protein
MLVRIEGLLPGKRVRWMAPVVWTGVVVAWPLLQLLPDIDAVVFRQPGAREGGG